jgi:Pvc16 N-terminal domain
MSNFLAVATVTAALQRLLQQPVAADVPGAKVTAERPDTLTPAPGEPTVNVYLYQVVTDPAWRNQDLPTRRPDGSVVQRPRAALDLHYLISFHGNDSDLEPQRLLGSTVRTLNARPIVTRQLIEGVVAAAGAAQDPKYPWLVTTDLGDAAEVVRFCPMTLDLEELSKLWSVFLETPHALSTIWTASVVLLQQDEAVQPSPPVTAPTLTVAPLRGPRIDRVEVATDPRLPVTDDRTVRIGGSQLYADGVVVRVAGVELAPASATDTAVEVDLSTAPAPLRAGTVTVQVVHPWLVGTPPSRRGETASNAFAMPLHPRVTEEVRLVADAVELEVAPPVGRRQQAALELLDPTTGAVARLLAVPDRPADAGTLTVPVASAAPGTYAVVLRVDGVPSPTVRDAAGTITFPRVTLP